MLGITNSNNGWLTNLIGALKGNNSEAKMDKRTKEEPTPVAGALQVKVEEEDTIVGTDVSLLPKTHEMLAEAEKLDP
jgi:hypothetical protein